MADECGTKDSNNYITAEAIANDLVYGYNEYKNKLPQNAGKDKIYTGILFFHILVDRKIS